MKSKLTTIGTISLMLGLIVSLSTSATHALPATDMSDRTITVSTIIVRYAASADASRTAAPAETAPVAAAADTQMPYTPSARPASNQPTVSSRQIATDTPAGWLEREAQRGNQTGAGRGLSETPPCLGAGHYYDASVVNSVPSSCFAGNSGPAPLGGLF
jgi:hypothetical protein